MRTGSGRRTLKCRALHSLKHVLFAKVSAANTIRVSQSVPQLQILWVPLAVSNRFSAAPYLNGSQCALGLASSLVLRIVAVLVGDFGLFLHNSSHDVDNANQMVENPMRIANKVT